MRKIPRVLKISQKAVNSVKPSVHCHDMGKHTESCRRLVGTGVTQRSCGAASPSPTAFQTGGQKRSVSIPPLLWSSAIFFSEISCFAGHWLPLELCSLLPLELICLSLTAPLFGRGLLISEGYTEILEPAAEALAQVKFPRGTCKAQDLPGDKLQTCK